MWRIPGYHHTCEYPDLLHCLYLGTVRDATASHLMELARYSPQLQAYETWDERLHQLHGDFQMWCREHHFRPSLLDGLSHLATPSCSCLRVLKALPACDLGFFGCASCHSANLRSGQAGDRCDLTGLSAGTRQGLDQSRAVAWQRESDEGQRERQRSRAQNDRCAQDGILGRAVFCRFAYSDFAYVRMRGPRFQVSLFQENS